MITRTCNTTNVTIKVYNEATDSVEQIEKEIIGKLDENGVKKALSKMGMNVLKVIAINHKTELRAMSEQTYLDNSYVIPDRKKKEDK